MRRLAMAFLCCTACWTQEPPNLSGTWKLIPDESDFAGQNAPKSRTETITQKGSDITENVTDGTGAEAKTATIHYTTDGKAAANHVFESDTTSTAKWDGPDLVIHTTSRTNGKTVSYDDRWTLSLNGDHLTVRRHYADKGLGADQMLIYHKPSSTE